MGFKKANETNDSANFENNKPKLDLAGGFYAYQIQNVRVLSDTVVTFTLDLGIGVALYNMKLVEKKDGGYFISVPQTMSKNGKYYNQYGVYLTAESEQLLIDELFKQLG